MIVKTEMLSKVKDYFDLNLYETKVWLALLGKGVASAGQIAEISRVPRSRTYDVLESLEKKGFAIIKLGKPVKYIGVKPHLIIEKLKNNVKRAADERILSLGKVKSTEEYQKIEEIYREGIDPVKREDLSSAIRGRSNISNYLKEILQNAEEEVIICTHAEDINSKLKLFKQTIDSLKKQNVKVKVALSGDDELIKEVSKILDIKVKKIEAESKFFIVDRKETLFYLARSSNKDETAIWINSEFFSQSFADLFDKAVGNN